MHSTPVTPTVSVLQRAVAFLAGFEDDPDQPGARELLADLRAAAEATAQVDLAAEAAAEAKIHASKVAIQQLLQRIQRDARIGYYFDPFTTSYESLTHAHCLLWELNLKDFREHYSKSLRYERPKCSGDCARGN